MSAQLAILPSTPNLESFKDIWVFLELINGEFIEHSLEAIAAARKISSRTGRRVGAVVLGHRLPNWVFEAAIKRGADYVIYADHERLRHYEPLVYTEALTSMCRELKPWAFIFMADELGRDLAPRLAYRLTTGLATDNIDFEVEDYYYGLERKRYEKILAQVRPDFATRIAKIYTPRHRPQIASLRPGYFKPLDEDDSRSGDIIEYKLRLSGVGEDRIRVLETKRMKRGGDELEKADFIVGLGLGVLRDKKGNPADPARAVKLAEDLINLVRDKLGVRTGLGATRALIYADIKELRDKITRDRQIGQTGRAVAPKVYVAAGVSGSIQHKVGIMRAKNIVAINVDPGAPIFEMANYIVVEDLYEALPKIHRSLLKQLGGRSA